MWSDVHVALHEYPDLRERLERTLAEIDRLARDRNAAIHTYWAIDLPGGNNFTTSARAIAQTFAPRLRAAIQRTFASAFRSLDKFVRFADRLL
jgi:hypothetical protein